MAGLTKAQRKDNERIQAWIEHREFRENSKSKPAVPDLDPEYVLDHYHPVYASEHGAFWTPQPMACAHHNFTLEAVAKMVHLNGQPQMVDPCVGIGGLLLPFLEQDWLAIKGWEAAAEYVNVASMIYADESNVEIAHTDAFDRWDEVEQYDFVVMNPPYGITWCQGTAAERCTWGAKRSEHRFLELGLRLVKPGGILSVVAPWNFIDGLPGKASAEFNRIARLVMKEPRDEAEFALTKVRVSSFLIEKVRTQEVIERPSVGERFAVLEKTAQTALF